MIQQIPSCVTSDVLAAYNHDAARKWYALFTLPKHEKAVVKQLDLRGVECFLPTYEEVRVWKNRQRMKLVLPLFPTYLFLRISPQERARAIEAPGVLHIVGNSRGPLPLQDSEIEFMRAGIRGEKVEPYRDLVVGQKARIKCGAMEGVQGTLVRKNKSLRFVLTLELINQHAAIEVNADDLEMVAD
jgi:transcription antitermination factor NusG